MSARTLAALAIMAAPILPLTVTVPAAAAGAATVQTAPHLSPHARHRAHLRHRAHKAYRARLAAKARAAKAARTAVTGARVRVLARARQALGRPYRYGAAGPYSFDCAGLVQWAYAGAGKRLPRTAAAQLAAGRRVTRAHIADVLVYGGGTHVALVTKVSATGRVLMTEVARHTGTPVGFQAPYEAYQVVSFLA